MRAINILLIATKEDRTDEEGKNSEDRQDRLMDCGLVTVEFGYQKNIHS